MAWMAMAMAVVMAMVLSGAQAIAKDHHDGAQPFTPQNIQSTPACVIPAIDGENVPFPLRQANTKFELSQNQTYILNGTLVQMKGVVYLKVDFTSQPWLATEKLLQFPYFPMDSISAKDVYKYAGKLVQMAVFTQANSTSNGPNEEETSGLKLSAILSPVAL